MEQLAVQFIAGRYWGESLHATGAATNAVVIKVGEASGREIQQEMRRWRWAYGEIEAAPPPPTFSTHLVVCATTNISCAQIRQLYKFRLVWTKPPIIQLLISHVCECGKARNHDWGCLRFLYSLL